MSISNYYTVKPWEYFFTIAFAAFASAVFGYGLSQMRVYQERINVPQFKFKMEKSVNPAPLLDERFKSGNPEILV
jgi:hypothetical protein